MAASRKPNPDDRDAGARRVVVLSGAGISAESGLDTFRGADGLWEGHRVEDVATPAGWRRDPATVLAFYNERRRQVRAARPNAAHFALARLEGKYPVDVITQNIDDLHERAGSSNVLHLHGEILLARSSVDDSWIEPLGGRDIHLGDTCPRGAQLRPHVVWFGEPVPAMATAAGLVATANILLVVGTSLLVYPAASLVHLAPARARKIVVNPEIPESLPIGSFECLAEPAGIGVPRLVDALLK